MIDFTFNLLGVSYSDLFETFHFDNIRYQCPPFIVNYCNQLTFTLSLEMFINEFQRFNPAGPNF